MSLITKIRNESKAKKYARSLFDLAVDSKLNKKMPEGELKDRGVATISGHYSISLPSIRKELGAEYTTARIENRVTSDYAEISEDFLGKLSIKLSMSELNSPEKHGERRVEGTKTYKSFAGIATPGNEKAFDFLKNAAQTLAPSKAKTSSALEQQISQAPTVQTQFRS